MCTKGCNETADNAGCGVQRELALDFDCREVLPFTAEDEVLVFINIRSHKIISNHEQQKNCLVIMYLMVCGFNCHHDKHNFILISVTLQYIT